MYNTLYKAQKSDGLFPIYLSPITGEANGGSFSMGASADSYYEYLEKAFYEHSEAEKYVVDKIAMCKRLESYRDEWEEIENVLENAVPDEYWDENSEYWSNTNEIPEYWRDNEETFINAVKEILPDKYEKYGETTLIEMYNYFEVGYYKYSGQPRFYISETEIE